MTSEFPLCVWRKVSCQTQSGGVREDDAWTFGDFAVVHPLGRPSDWTILHLPSGGVFMSQHMLFRYQATAVAAMMDLAKLKNRWVFDNPEELEALRAAVDEVGRSHGGEAVRVGSGSARYRSDMNGYDRADS